MQCALFFHVFVSHWLSGCYVHVIYCASYSFRSDYLFALRFGVVAAAFFFGVCFEMQTSAAFMLNEVGWSCKVWVSFHCFEMLSRSKI